MKLLYGKNTINKKSGFTLIELVIGMAVFSILTTMVFGTVGSVRKISKQETIVSEETVEIQKVASDIERFIRETSQSITIDETVSNSFIITDTNNPSKVMKVELINKEILVDGKLRVGNIDDLDIEFDNVNKSSIEVEIESSSTRVPDLERHIRLRNK